MSWKCRARASERAERPAADDRARRGPARRAGAASASARTSASAGASCGGLRESTAAAASRPRSRQPEAEDERQAIRPRSARVLGGGAVARGLRLWPSRRRRASGACPGALTRSRIGARLDECTASSTGMSGRLEPAAALAIPAAQKRSGPAGIAEPHPGAARSPVESKNPGLLSMVARRREVAPAAPGARSSWNAAAPVAPRRRGRGQRDHAPPPRGDVDREPALPSLRKHVWNRPSLIGVACSGSGRRSTLVPAGS